MVQHGDGQGFEAPAYDDSAFQVGSAAFGTGGSCPLDPTIKTSWPPNTDILVRKAINLPAGTTGVTVHVAIDNDAIVYWNGIQIGSTTHEYCAARDTLIATAPDSAVIAGSNVLAVRGTDRGGLTYLDVQVTASIPLQGPQGPERLGDNNLSELNQSRCSCGDPIDTYSGNFSHTFTDLLIPGRGRPLLFSRTYNAQAASQNGPLGYGWTDSYTFSLSIDSSSGNVTVNQENGSTVTFAPNASGGYSAPPRVLAALVKNADGSFTFNRKDQTHYHFNASGQLTQEMDRNGYITSLTYQNNQLTTVTDPAGRTLSFGYDPNGRIISVTDPLNRKVSFQYDANGNLATASDVNGGNTSFTYNGNHLMLTMTDPRGGVVTNVYDASSRVISQTDPMGRKTTFSYSTNSTTITDPNGNVTLERYQNAVLVSETKGYGIPQAATWKYTYDPLSLGVTSVTDPNQHVWTNTWDAMGNLLSSTNPLKQTTTSTYDSLNDVTSITDPKGVTTTYTYDAKGNLLGTSRPLKGTSKTQTTTYTYSDASHPGDVTMMTDPGGKNWNYGYDQYGNRISSTDPLGNLTTFQYNEIGWKTSQVSPKGNLGGGKPSLHTTSYAYNAFGDVTLVTDPLGHKTTEQYDADRNLIQVTDTNGNLTQYTYDADNELTQITRADGSILKSSYDGDGNLLAQTDGLGNTTTYTYDPLNRVISLMDPLGRTTNYAYDRAGNRTSLTDAAGQVTTYKYDKANQLVTITYSDGKTPGVSFTYDADGERTSMTDGTGKTTYTYDSLNRLIKSTNGAGNRVVYEYNLNGQLIGLTYPGGGKVMRTYDAAGRLIAVRDWLAHKTSFTYDADGNLIKETYPNGVQGTFTYDRDNQVTSMTDSLGGTKLLSFVYTRNNLELLQSLQPGGVQQSNETYSYTALNQLSTVNQTTYQYDHGDNITQNGSAALMYDKANEVISLTQGSNTTQFGYDARGNRTSVTPQSGSAITLTYDQTNRLTAYGTTAQYVYNGDGLRTSKTVNGTAEAFSWDVAEGLPLLLQDGTTQYVYGPGGLPLEQVVPNGAVYWYHHDQLGSTRAITDANGNVQATYTYDPYGNTTSHTGTATTNLQFAGQYLDSESGLYYLRARYYDPATGQFVSRDPLVTETRQPYVYVADSPLDRQDPTGLSFWSGTKDFLKKTAPLSQVIGDAFGAASTDLGIGAVVAGGGGAVVAGLVGAEPVAAYMGTVSVAAAILSEGTAVLAFSFHAEACLGDEKEGCHAAAWDAISIVTDRLIGQGIKVLAPRFGWKEPVESFVDNAAGAINNWIDSQIANGTDEHGKEGNSGNCYPTPQPTPGPHP